MFTLVSVLAAAIVACFPNGDIDTIENHIPTPIAQYDVPGGVVFQLDNGHNYRCTDFATTGVECTGIYSIDSAIQLDS
jgi:hypothetical protein